MNIQTFLVNTFDFLNDVILPFLLAIAFFIFVWNAFRFFIVEGKNASSHEEARSLALWSILAFVIILSFWGLLNLIGNSFGLIQQTSITPDYMQTKNSFFKSFGVQESPVSSPTKQTPTANETQADPYDWSKIKSTNDTEWKNPYIQSN